MPTEPLRVRAPFGGLTEAEVEHIVEKVTVKVVENFYQEVGRNIISKVTWAIGLATVVFLTWLGLTGKLDR